MKILSAKQMFKEEESNVGCKSYRSGEQRVVKYGKINKMTSFRIIERVKWIYTNSLYDVEILTKNEDNSYSRASKSFWDETEPDGGIFEGKQYKSALEYANEYILSLESIDLLEIGTRIKTVNIHEDFTDIYGVESGDVGTIANHGLGGNGEYKYRIEFDEFKNGSTTNMGCYFSRDKIEALIIC